MGITAAYARVSDEVQRATSIDDQLRRCREVAQREGLILEERLVFSDLAITGKTEGLAKRRGYQRLCDAIAAKECSIVIVDEISRLTRSVHEGGRLMELVDSSGVHFLTHCGIDTRRDGWKTMWMFKMMMATSEVDGTSSRTSRGMVGQLERGFQIAQAPFGYRAFKEASASGREIGTKWLIYEPEAAIVRQMYQWRYDGMSCGGIARSLQDLNIATPGAARKSAPPYWRQASVHRILQNTIYRGIFIWNGSTFAKAIARKRQRQVEPVEYGRPQLRIVDDAEWYECNRSRVAISGLRPRGGGRHLCAGLVRCGDCQSLLSVQSGKVNKSMTCAVCEQKARIGLLDVKVRYTSTKAARLALEWVLEPLFSGPVREEFNSRLAARLVDGPQKELEEIATRLKEVDVTIDRIQTFMLNPTTDPGAWDGKLQVSTQEKRRLENRLEQLKSLRQQMSPAVLQAQVKADPLPFLRELLDGDAEVYKVKATLRRLLSKFELVDRPQKGESVFRIGLKPGVCLAEVSESTTIDDSVIEFEVTVSVGAARPVCWNVGGRRV
jgi:site-specific DNA recombinase